MRVIEYDDPTEFLEDCHEAIAAEPVLHSVLATVVQTTLDRPEVYPEFTFYAVERVGRQPTLAHHTPPYPFHIPTADPDAARALADHAHAHGVRPSGAGGHLESVLAFADRWTELTGEPAEVAMRLGLYDLEIEPVLPWPVAGVARWATDADVELVDAWSRAFHVEALGKEPPSGATLRQSIGDGRVMLWCDPEPVAIALATTAHGGVTRISGVYTPPERRGHGYASAVVAALSSDRRARGLTCMLYTDLANPTSNGIYTALGYRHLGDTVHLRFAR